MTCVEIRDASDPRLSPYRELHATPSREPSEVFIAEGRFLVRRLLASELTTESILCSDRCQDELSHLRDLQVPVYVAPLKLIREIVGFRFHRGMLACGRRPANRTLNTLVASASPGRLVVVCPRIVDPINLAGVIRNCAAFGVDGLLLGPHSADPFCRRVVRVSMATVFQLPLRVTNDLSKDLETLSEKLGFHTVATVLDLTAVQLSEAPRPHDLALLVGSEEAGLRSEWVQRCDTRVTLPMQRDTDSLNLATATGIFLYHYTHVARHVTANA